MVVAQAPCGSKRERESRDFPLPNILSAQPNPLAVGHAKKKTDYGKQLQHKEVH